MTLRKRLVAGLISGLLLLSLAGCSGKPEAAVISLNDPEPLPYKLTTVSGMRFPDRVNARCIFTGQPGWLLMEISVRIENPPVLAFGRYKWQRDGQVYEGNIVAESIDFLGGQADPPSLGGKFKLLSPEGLPTHRVTVPLSSVHLTK